MSLSSSDENNSNRISERSAKRSSAKRWLVLLGLLLIGLWWSLRQYRQQLANRETGFRPPVVTGSSDAGQSSDVPSDSRLPAHPLDPVLALAESIKAKIQSEVVDYTATITKRERIRGKLYDAESMEAKIRNPNPGQKTALSVYLKFVPPSSAAGREVIWVDGKNSGQLISYQFRVPIKLAPDSGLAMFGNKYPITEIGLLKMTEKLLEKGQRDRGIGDCKVEIFEQQLVGERTCKLVQVTHPERKEKYDFHIAQVYIDNELGVPIRYAAYLWPASPGEAPPLEEEYTYDHLRLNVGLTDLDFDPKNPSYSFP